MGAESLQFLLGDGLGVLPYLFKLFRDSGYTRMYGLTPDDRSGTISAYGDGTGVSLHGTGGASEKRRRGLCADLQVQGTDGAGRI